MSIFTKSKPRPAATFKPPDDGKIYFHSGESKTGFNQAVKYENFLGEVMKFFPNFMQEGYQQGKEKTLSESGIGSWAQDWNTAAPTDTKKAWTRGYEARGILDGDYGNRYGDIHTNELDDTYWGYGAGKGAKNFEFAPAASEWNHFLTEDPEDPSTTFVPVEVDGADTPINMSDYSSLLYAPGSIAPALGTIDSSLWSQVQSYLGNSRFQGKSYYEIALQGVDQSSITTDHVVQWDLDGDGVKETYHSIEQSGGANYHVVHNGSFLYDGMQGSNGEGAFDLMLAMVESRRRINYGMSWLYGSPYMISDNQAMLDHMKSVFNDDDKLGRVNPQNKRILEAFFGAQHSLRAIMPAFSGGTGYNPLGEVGGINEFNACDGGSTGYVYSAKDTVAFQRFRHWVRNNVEAYISSLSGDTQTNAQNLYNEFTFVYDAPYGMGGEGESTVNGDGSVTKNPAYIGWDRFSANWWGPSWNGYWNFDKNHVSPVVYDHGAPHYAYAVAQVLGLSDDQRIGSSSASGSGSSTIGNVYNYNWVVHAEGDFIKWRKGVIAQNMLALALDNMERRRYRKDMQKYNQWKVDKKDQDYDDKRDEAIHEKRRAERLRIEKSRGKGPVTNKKSDNKQTKPAAKPSNSAKDLQKAQQKLRVAMMSKIMQAGKARSNNSKEAGKS